MSTIDYSTTPLPEGTVIPKDTRVLPDIQDTIQGERLYTSSQKNVQFIFPNGRVAHFKGGRFVTDNAYEIAILDTEVAGKHPVINYDPSHKYLTEDEKFPEAALRKKYFAEFQAEQAKFMDVNANVTTSDQGKFKPASTTDIAPVAAGGNAVSTATLVGLLAKNTTATPKA